MLNTTNIINPKWGDYDKAVAECHLANFGIIFLDEYNFPIDDEDYVEDLFVKYKYS